jgi:hypothetical protein
LLRSLSIILTVAAIAAVISHFESAQGDRQMADFQGEVQQVAWIRTADGWEPSTVLTAESASTPPSLHPALVASFELGVSLFALLAFPSRKSM